MSAENGTGVPHFTPTEQRILDVVKDGKPHGPVELHKCLDDELSPVIAIRCHLSNMRKKLRPMGYDIVHVMIGRTHHYRYVSLADLAAGLPSLFGV